MKSILKAVGLGVLAGVVIGGYMTWKKNKEVQEKIDEVFNDEFVENVVDKTVENLKDVNDKVQEDIQNSFDELWKTKGEIYNNIKKRHEMMDEEIKKMEENTKDLEKVVEALQETKENLETVAENVEEITVTEAEKENHEKNMKILDDCEKKIDDLLDDLNK